MMLSKVRIKYIQSLGQKKFRQQERMFLAEGPKLVAEWIAAYPAAVQEVFALRSWIDAHPEQAARIAVTEISEQELEKISQLVTPHEVLAIVKQFSPGVLPAFQGQWILLLDGIRDPGNLGTILRIADWFGIQQVICSEDCAELYNPKVVQATMGSMTRVAVGYTDPADWLRQQGEMRVYAATLDGMPLREAGSDEPGVLIIGNEAAGIRPALLSLASRRISIPRRGGAESLNAAVATGILLSWLIP